MERDGNGVPRATPDSADALSLVCRLAHEEGWKIRVEGRGTWLAADAPSDLVVSTRGLEQIVSVSPADLVATVQAGTSLEALRRRLADYGMWLALDPPGRPERSIGSVVATATAGPLRHGFGPVRDHVLGCSVATGDGRLVNAGGRVVKNVAGYDLTKLQVGGLRRLRHHRGDPSAAARAAPGRRDSAGPRRARCAHLRQPASWCRPHLLPGALELLSPALAAEPDWVLAARFVGTDAAVQADVRRLGSVGELNWQPLAGRSHRRILERGGAGQPGRADHPAPGSAGRRDG